MKDPIGAAVCAVLDAEFHAREKGKAHCVVESGGELSVMSLSAARKLDLRILEICRSPVVAKSSCDDN